MSNEPFETQVWEGRILYKQTYWWATQTRDWSFHLYCIHDINLREECKECANANR